MNGTFAVALLCVATWALFIALVSMPRWFARTLHGHRLWRLRDEFVDALIAGQLPRDHEAVRLMLLDMEFVAQNGKQLTMLDLYICRWLVRRMDPESRAVLEGQLDIPHEDLSQAERELFESFYARFSMLAGGSMLLGSWIGLATVARFFPRALRQAIRDKSPDIGERVTRWGKNATDLAATETRLGQQSGHLLAHQHAMSSVRADRSSSTFTFRS
jgi:hypothetical protein